MSKLKTFEEYTSEKLKKEANTISEATVVMDAVDPNSKGLAKLLKKNKVSMEILDMEGPSGYPEVELTGSRKDLVTVLSDPDHGWDDAGLAEYIEESKGTNAVSEATVIMDAMDPNSKGLAKLLKKNKVSMEILDMEGPSGYPEVELRGSRKDLVAVLSDPNHGWDDADLAEYIEESKEAKESKESKLVSEMLQDVYESCKNEAKAYEEDAHDDHTIESYMVENAALIATLAAKSLNEMKEEYSKEAYEAACNSMVESYTKKMDEMKESNSPEDAGDLAESNVNENYSQIHKNLLGLLSNHIKNPPKNQ
jgi:hypothetical protein